MQCVHLMYGRSFVATLPPPLYPEGAKLSRRKDETDGTKDDPHKYTQSRCQLILWFPEFLLHRLLVHLSLVPSPSL